MLHCLMRTLRHLANFMNLILVFIRILIPTTLMFGGGAVFYIFWITIKITTFPFPYWIYQYLEDRICFEGYQRYVLFFVRNWAQPKLYLYGDVDAFRKKERIIYMANHQSSLDWVIVHLLAEAQNSLGHCRYVLKDTIQFVPIFGYYLYMHGSIFIKRGKKNFNSYKMEKSLKNLKDPDIPSWIAIFPEGTRFNPLDPNRLYKSKFFAKEMQWKPLDNVLMPRSRGFNILLEHMRKYLDAVYDVTIIYPSTKDRNLIDRRLLAPSMFEFMSGCCPEVHVHINRIDINQVPYCEEDNSIWLYELFKRKDKLLQDYYFGSNSSDIIFDGSKGVLCGGQKPKLTNIIGILILCSYIPFFFHSKGWILFVLIWIFAILQGYIHLYLASIA